MPLSENAIEIQICQSHNVSTKTDKNFYFITSFPFFVHVCIIILSLLFDESNINEVLKYTVINKNMSLVLNPSVVTAPIRSQEVIGRQVEMQTSVLLELANEHFVVRETLVLVHHVQLRAVERYMCRGYVYT